MDDRIRRLERKAAQGDYEARCAWKCCLVQIGEPDPDQVALEARLTEWEETQSDYDEIWWHSKGPKHFAWNSGCTCCQDWSKWAAKLTKAHHTWGHRWGGQNSNLKTLRTHRRGSRARKVRLAYSELCPVPEWVA